MANAGAIRECLACEKSFSPFDALQKGVHSTFVEQYCSPECQNEFENVLEASKEIAIERGLLTPEGEATLKGNANPTNNLTQQNLNDLIAKFSPRVKI